jgi:hypothetical protein
MLTGGVIHNNLAKVRQVEGSKCSQLQIPIKPVLPSGRHSSPSISATFHLEFESTNASHGPARSATISRVIALPFRPPYRNLQHRGGVLFVCRMMCRCRWISGCSSDPPLARAHTSGDLLFGCASDSSMSSRSVVSGTSLRVCCIITPSLRPGQATRRLTGLSVQTPRDNQWPPITPSQAFLGCSITSSCLKRVPVAEIRSKQV